LQALLTWQCNSVNEDGYAVEQSTDGVNFTQIGTTGRGVTTYLDMPSQPGTYSYRVRAFNVAGNSDYSNIIQVDVPDVPPPGGGAHVASPTPQLPFGDSALLVGTLEMRSTSGGTASPDLAATPGKLSSGASVPMVSPLTPMTEKAMVEKQDYRSDLGSTVHDVRMQQLAVERISALNALDEWFVRDMMGRS
jgi:hypothetical protein